MRDYQREYRTRVLNKRLNESEKRLRGRIGSRKVDALIIEFRLTAILAPLMFTELYRQPDPYRWLADEWSPRQGGAAFDEDANSAASTARSAIDAGRPTADNAAIGAAPGWRAPAITSSDFLPVRWRLILVMRRVEIDWKRVEEVAAPSPDDRWRDKTSEAIAKVMLSIRDKTYTEPDKAPLPQPAPPGGTP